MHPTDGFGYGASVPCPSASRVRWFCRALSLIVSFPAPTMAVAQYTVAMSQPRLEFTNYRLVAGADYKNPKVWSGPWLERSRFEAHELPQLRRVLQEWGIRGDDPFAIPCKDFQGMAEVPLERWDAVDPSGVPLYSVWTYMVDSGMIWRYGTAEIVGQIIQFGGELEDPELAAALEAARTTAREADPKAPLPPTFV